MTENEQIDEILMTMFKGHLIGLSKDSSELEISAVNKLVAFGLISPRDNTFDLTDKGYKAFELGGFRQFLDFQEKQRQPIPSQHLTINAPITGSQLGLSSDFGDLAYKNENINQEAKQKPKEKSFMWDTIPDWAKILGGIGAIASLIKVFYKP